MQSKSKVWTFPLITNYRLGGEGWFFPGGLSPSGLKSVQKEKPMHLLCWQISHRGGAGLSQLHRIRLPSLWRVSHSGWIPILISFFPSPTSSPLHPAAKAVMEPSWPTLYRLPSLNSQYNFTHLYPLRGSAANRVCCLQRIPEALRYKGSVIEWLGRKNITEGDFCQHIQPPPPQHPKEWRVDLLHVINIAGGGRSLIIHVWLMEDPALLSVS